MAKRQYLDITGLQTYDGKIKAYINAADAKKADKTEIPSIPEALKNPNSLTIQANGTTLTNGVYDGSAAKTVNITKSSIGLGNVDNTSDANKPVSTAQQSAIDTAKQAAITHANTELAKKSDTGHKHDDDYYAKTSGEQLAATLAEVKEDVDAFFADADFSTNAKDTLKELQAYMTSDAADAEDFLEALATKVNITDIVDNLTSTATNKPLSAKQGKELKTLVDAKASQTALDTHMATHAPSNAQANVIESIKVNGTAQTISSKSVNITVPTNNNQLTNGAGYLVAADIAGKADKTALDSVSSVANEAKTAAAANTQSISANTTAINGHTTRIVALEGLVGEGIEAIPEASITALFA